MRLNVKRHRRRSFLCAAMAAVFSMAGVSYAESLGDPPFFKGETIIYDIRKLKLRVGEGTLVYKGQVDLKGRSALLITFTAKGFRFFDHEKIYLEPQTFYPLMIERDLDIFGVKEKITEFYDAESGKVKIVKIAKGKETEQVIESDERFDNIYGFIYRYRQRGQFHMGEEFRLHLPTRDVTFTLIEKSKFKTAGKEFDAYCMDSIPKKYKVWFDRGQKRIPLMIDGAVGFGHTSMVMKNYDAGNL